AGMPVMREFRLVYQVARRGRLSPVTLSSILQHLPQYTLFPYTTLFRSLAGTAVVSWAAWERDKRGASADGQVGKEGTKKNLAVGDRKSTRLNSSQWKARMPSSALKKKVQNRNPCNVNHYGPALATSFLH